MLSVQVLPPPGVQEGEVMLAVSEMESPVSGVAGAVKWNVSSVWDPDGKLVNVPLVASAVVKFPVLVMLQVPLKLEVESPPLLLFLIAKVTLKFAPVSALRLALVGVSRETAIFRLSVKVFCASDWLPVAVR